MAILERNTNFLVFIKEVKLFWFRKVKNCNFWFKKSSFVTFLLYKTKKNQFSRFRESRKKISGFINWEIAISGLRNSDLLYSYFNESDNYWFLYLRGYFPGFSWLKVLKLILMMFYEKSIIFIWCWERKL